MIGTDISEHQAVGVGLWGEYVIIRASNGRRRDYRVFDHVNAARARGLPISLYTYCEPGNNTPEFQADLLTGVARDAGIPQTVKLYSDIEEGGGDLSWYEDRFIARVEANGWRCDTYSGNYFWNAHGLDGRGDPWKAAYGNNDGTIHRWVPDQPWSIWQYTSNPLDTNTADQAAVDRIFRGSAGPPKPKPPVFFNIPLFN